MTSEETVRIPLFPLPLVILPGEAIPLHIYEDRYKQLVQDVEPLGLLGVFGISLVTPDGFTAVGCGVHIERFLKRFENGTSDVLVRGVMRYTIRSLYEEKIYLEARVAPLNDDPADEPPSPLREQAISLHARYSEMMTGRPVIEQNESKVPLSFILASVAQMPNDLKQKLLELSSEHARLELLIGHYQTVISEVSPKAEVERIVKSNGILKH